MLCYCKPSVWVCGYDASTDIPEYLMNDMLHSLWSAHYILCGFKLQ